MVVDAWAGEVVLYHFELVTGSVDLKDVDITTSPRMSAVCAAVLVVRELLLWQILVIHRQWKLHLDTVWVPAPWLELQALDLSHPLLVDSALVVVTHSTSGDHQAPMPFHQAWVLLLVHTRLSTPTLDPQVVLTRLVHSTAAQLKLLSSLPPTDLCPLVQETTFIPTRARAIHLLSSPLVSVG